MDDHRVETKTPEGQDDQVLVALEMESLKRLCQEIARNLGVDRLISGWDVGV